MTEDNSGILQPLDNTDFLIENDVEVVSVYENETTVQQLLEQALEILTKAYRWANEAEGIEIEPGKYSAFNFSSKTKQIYDQFVIDRQGLAQNTLEFNTVLDFVKRLVNELPDVEITPGSGLYSAKHYLSETTEVYNRAYLQFNDIRVLYDNLVNVKANIERLYDLAKAYASAPQGTFVESGLESARSYATYAKDYRDTIALLNDQFIATNSQIATAIIEGRPNALRAEAAALDATSSKNAAKTSETNAKTSETNTKTSETNAKTSETNSKTSETNSATSATSSAASAAFAKNVADNFAGIADLSILDDNTYLIYIS